MASQCPLQRILSTKGEAHVIRNEWVIHRHSHTTIKNSFGITHKQIVATYLNFLLFAHPTHHKLRTPSIIIITLSGCVVALNLYGNWIMSCCINLQLLKYGHSKWFSISVAAALPWDVVLTIIVTGHAIISYWSYIWNWMHSTYYTTDNNNSPPPRKNKISSAPFRVCNAVDGVKIFRSVMNCI